MGIFSKIFGSGGGQQTTKVRAQFKDGAYFQKEVTRFEQIAEEMEKKPPQQPDPFYYWSFAGKLNKILELEYSAGKQVDGLVDIYKRSLDNYVKGWDKNDPTYEDLLNMVSWGILLDIPASDFRRLEQYIERADSEGPENWKPDALLWYLVRRRLNNAPSDIGATLFPAIYQPLFDITQLPKADAENAVREYLGKWYELRKGSPWFNTHARDKGYSGYWAWDVAAVVKVMGLDDSSFKDNPYYPYDIVHWRD
ncbi:PoNe immunity protein domain-containing protein [Chitinophaga sp. S165]|uniref:PoNe immunity protein domain-containing protein n=1 Tax=Chitinophaga sp. S165 TaxID=2135462 RepID=UPI000D715635|nr:PoNe immunity protein domain-containing protein [Chitinophaga sp. S165]PWV47732.1 uncharacterized protein DUF1910 [Chitinophaga sp. S165]